MTFTDESLLITWLFSDVSSDETAATQLRATDLGGFGSVAALTALTTADLQGLYTAYTTFANGAPLQWADYSDLVGVKVAALGTSGQYLTDPKLYEAVAPTGGATENIAPQLTVVMTLWSGSSFGRANYGRMYLPHTRIPLVAGTSRASAADAGSVAIQADGFLNSVNAVLATPTGAEVVIMSAVGGGTTKVPAQVGIGRVIDTQRRRRRSLDEDIQYVTI